MHCPSCEADVADGSRYCPYCGQDLASDGPAVDEDPAATTAVRPPLGSREGPALRSCPRCGAPNSQHRVLCGRCGSDLETGDLGVDPRPASSTAPGRPGDTDHAVGDRVPSRRAWIVVVVLGALIGSAIGLTVWLRSDGVGPGGDPQPTFDPARYVDEPSALTVDRVSASSQLSPEGSISYEPALAIDGDPSTAWNEGAEGGGEGEHLRLELAQPSWVRRIVIRNGYQKDDRTFFDNARAARLLARFDGGTYVVELQDLTGEQVVTLPEPVLTVTVTLEVLEVVPGQQYDDLAISEVGVLGWPSREEPSG